MFTCYIQCWDEKQKHPKTVLVKVRINIDAQKIADTMGPKAYRNRSRSSRLLHGAITVKAERSEP